MNWRIGALAVADLALLALGLFDLASTPLVLFGHTMGTLLTFFTFREGQQPPGLAVLLVAALGPPALLVAILCTRRAARIVTPRTAARLDGAIRDARSSAARLLDGRLYHADATALGSLATILRHGSVHHRRRALETAVRSFQPAMSPLVAQALTDRDQTIRALAAAAAARISQNLSKERAMLEEKHAAGDRSAGSRLASLLADHASNNILLSDSQRESLRRESLALRLQEQSKDPTNDPGAGRERGLIQALWAAGNYNVIDTISVAGISGETASDRLQTSIAWWHAQAAQ